MLRMWAVLISLMAACGNKEEPRQITGPQDTRILLFHLMALRFIWQLIGSAKSSGPTEGKKKKSFCRGCIVEFSYQGINKQASINNAEASDIAK